MSKVTLIPANKEEKKDKQVGNPQGINQWSPPDPRESLFWAAYIDAKSKTFSNAYQSALVAGYSKASAGQITSFGWYIEKCRRMNLLEKAEKVLQETVEMSHLVPIIGMFGPTLNPDGTPAMKESPAILAIKQNTAKFIAERLGKNKGYTTRVEHTGPNGDPIEIEATVKKRIDDAIDLHA